MSEESQLGPSNNGSVMVDVGGDRGALIIVTPQDRAGDEIEISAIEPNSPRTHVAVRERRGPAQTRYAAVFPTLRAGDYTIWCHKGEAEVAGTVTITGGEIAELDWSQSGR